MNLKLIIISIIVILAIALSSYFIFFKSPEKSPNTQTIKVEKQDITVKIQATGTIEPQNRVKIIPPVPGRIDQILVEEGQKVKKGQIIAWMSSTSRATLLDIARSKSEDELKLWEDTYRPTPVVAPVDGVIVKKGIVPGETVTQQSELFEMSDILIARAQVDETDISQIRLGLDAEVTLDAFLGKTLTAKTSKISQQSSIVNSVNIYYIELVFDKGQDTSFLRSGMTANVDFIVAEQKDVTVLPIWAVQGQSNTTIQIMKPNKTLEDLELGISDGEYVEIKSEIDNNYEILVEDVSIEGLKRSGSFLEPKKNNRGGGKRR